jgi:NTP pyrophosphatase (non-canonical NTP hydrolase)
MSCRANRADPARQAGCAAVRALLVSPPMINPEIEARWTKAITGREPQAVAAVQAFGNLLRLMADLRGAQGCPWDREQSLASLRQYVIEEAHEVCEAIDAILDLEAQARELAGLPAANPQPPEADDKARTATKGLSISHHPHHADFDPTASASGAPLPTFPSPSFTQAADRLYANLFKEIGDLLLQAVFLGDILQAMGRGGVDRAAEAIVAKLIHRHPHVYGTVEATDSAAVLANWEKIKQAERSSE